MKRKITYTESTDENPKPRKSSSKKKKNDFNIKIGIVFILITLAILLYTMYSPKQHPKRGRQAQPAQRSQMAEPPRSGNAEANNSNQSKPVKKKQPPSQAGQAEKSR